MPCFVIVNNWFVQKWQKCHMQLIAWNYYIIIHAYMFFLCSVSVWFEGLNDEQHWYISDWPSHKSFLDFWLNKLIDLIVIGYSQAFDCHTNLNGWLNLQQLMMLKLPIPERLPYKTSLLNVTHNKWHLICFDWLLVCCLLQKKLYMVQISVHWQKEDLF